MAVVDTRVRSGVLTLCGDDYSCQPTSVAITPSTTAGGTGNEIEVLCGDKVSDGGSAEDFTATLDITQIADFANPSGLQKALWTNIGKECEFVWQPTSSPDDTWRGKVKIQPNVIGGTVGERLTPTVSLEITELHLPTRMDPNNTKIIPFTIAILGITAGQPAVFNPTNATPPADLAAIKAHTVIGDGGTAKPTGAWTTGQYVTLGDGSFAHWDGTAWVVGKAP